VSLKMKDEGYEKSIIEKKKMDVKKWNKNKFLFEYDE
jgi:hypothetical protein